MALISCDALLVPLALAVAELDRVGGAALAGERRGKPLLRIGVGLDVVRRPRRRHVAEPAVDHLGATLGVDGDQDFVGGRSLSGMRRPDVAVIQGVRLVRKVHLKSPAVVELDRGAPLFELHVADGAGVAIVDPVLSIGGAKQHPLPHREIPVLEAEDVGALALALGVVPDLASVLQANRHPILLGVHGGHLAFISSAQLLGPVVEPDVIPHVVVARLALLRRRHVFVDGDGGAVAFGRQ